MLPSQNIHFKLGRHNGIGAVLQVKLAKIYKKKREVKRLFTIGSFPHFITCLNLQTSFGKSTSWTCPYNSTCLLKTAIFRAELLNKLELHVPNGVWKVLQAKNQSWLGWVPIFFQIESSKSSLLKKLRKLELHVQNDISKVRQVKEQTELGLFEMLCFQNNLQIAWYLKKSQIVKTTKENSHFPNFEHVHLNVELTFFLVFLNRTFLCSKVTLLRGSHKSLKLLFDLILIKWWRVNVKN